MNKISTYSQTIILSLRIFISSVYKIGYYCINFELCFLKSSTYLIPGIVCQKLLQDILSHAQSCTGLL